MDAFKRKVLFPYLAIILMMLSLGQAQQCSQTEFSTDKNPPCPDGLNPAFTVQSQGQFSNMCCDEKGVIEQKRQAKSCRTTECVVDKSQQANPCSTLPEYIVDGETMSYEESLRDNCIEERSGESGIAAVCCRPDSVSNLLVSAYGAEPNEFPHQAQLKGPGLCGGTVYNQDTIITAAHCLVDDEGHVNTVEKSGWEVILGTNIGNMRSKNTVYPVNKVIVHKDYSRLASHPEFKKGDQARIFNDIAILKLGRKIDFSENPNIRALPIAPEGFRAGKYAKQAIIMGWGTSEDLAVTQHLQKTNVLLRQDESCFRGFPYGDMKEHEKQVLCVGGHMNGTRSPTAGEGDSGGPAVCRGEDGYPVLCGVTSYGGDDEACRENQDEMSCPPSVYAEVSYFRDWIQKNGGKQDNSSFYRKSMLYGERIKFTKHPHQVRVMSTGGKPCGGTLVAQNKVVTAAHCIFTEDGTKREGIKVMTPHIKNPAGGNVFRSKTVHRPATFKKYEGLDSLNKGKTKAFKDAPFADDIAVITLARPIPIPKNKLAKLPREARSMEPKPGTAKEISYHSGRKSLMEREFNILDATDCQRRLDRFKVLKVDAKFDTNKIFCGVETYSGGSTCDRESGGGLICHGNVLCGVQSFRMCSMSLPNAFINVRNYLSMIKLQLKN